MIRTDFSFMSNVELANAYNYLVDTAASYDLSGYRKVARFADRGAGIKRCEAIESSIKAAQSAREATKKEPIVTRVSHEASVPASEAPREKKKPKLHNQEWVDKFNALVPEAIELGVKCKIHTSGFSSPEHGAKMVHALKEKIEAAKRAPAEGTEAAA